MDASGSREHPISVIIDDDLLGVDDDAELQAALVMSLQDIHQQQQLGQDNGDQPTAAAAAVPYDVIDDTDEEVDEELREALRLSIQPHFNLKPPPPSSTDADHHETTNVTLSSAAAAAFNNIPRITNDIYIPTFAAAAAAASAAAGEPSAQQQPQLWREPQPVPQLDAHLIQQSYQTAEPYDIINFHAIMWDATLTTDNDKARWVEQGIQYREDYDDLAAEGSLAEVLPWTEPVRFDQLTRSPVPYWGFVQQHGGPCGVLAAVQAEVLRALIWGPLTCNSLSTSIMLEALGRAIGTILARAALTGPVESTGSDDGLKAVSDADDSVRLVLPTSKQDQPLTWEDFEPWSMAEESAKSQFLAVYTIPTTVLSEGHSPKRQKTADDGLAVDENQPNSGELEERIDRLAQIVAAFLLQAGSPLPPPIHHFRHAGGIMLLVMSLVASRTGGGGCRRLEDEFDDAIGTRLTAQFGHCGQELMNLLLTGQAVSNVFDHTLKPSGNMICRGISNRPIIGYLSQLESLRYCQVGTFYKSPRYPIWVVGSTSHFTCLFGPAAALNESQSDLLLEQCRRAFKAAEGGDENGFITTEQLGPVLDSLNLHQDELNLSLLAATLEVNGAGIILWDDFWKTTSRLLTGASLDTVLGSDEEPPPLLLLTDRPDSIDSTATTNTTAVSAVETDEEMARRLANEWRWEDSNSVGAVNGGSPINFPSDTEDDNQKKPWPESQDTSNQGDLLGTQYLDDAMMMEDSKPPATTKKVFELETFGNTFPLYHYNGLRGGVLTKFQVTRLTPEEAVGASIALNRLSNTAASSADLEDVIRTKWPSCSINWLGKAPPYID